MKFTVKLPAIFRRSKSHRSSAFSTVSRSDPPSFGSCASSLDLKQTPKSVLPTSASWPGSSPEKSDFVPCDFNEVFRILDKDGDGKIPGRELEELLIRIGSDPATSAAMVREADADGDGEITMEEFGALSKAVESTISGGNELVEAFQVYDADGDGRISPEELYGVLSAVDQGCTLEDCRKMIRRADSDGDGFVGFEDFERLMRTQR